MAVLTRNSWIKLYKDLQRAAKQVLFLSMKFLNLNFFYSFLNIIINILRKIVFEIILRKIVVKQLKKF